MNSSRIDQQKHSKTNDTHSSSWSLLLYINGASPKSLSAITNLQNICEEYLTGNYQVEVIDLLEQPHLAEADQIIAIPTLVRRHPLPTRQVIGDLSNTQQALNALQIKTILGAK